MLRTALVQLNATDDPAANLPVTLGFIGDAARAGAKFILTPEVTNCVSSNRDHQTAVLQHEEDDTTLAALRAEAKALQIWLLIGSLGLKTVDPDGRFANRSFLISPLGDITARYDKIHMFDVDVSETESYRESKGYRPGARAVLADTDFARVGLTVCYDIRFPHLHRALAQAGAQILTVPAAFSQPTGIAHWETLLRARAIETGCFVLAPAQTGTHPQHDGKIRKTHGHSMVVAPWGEVLADGGTDPGITLVDLDISAVDAARRRVPALTHDRPFEGPL